MKTFQESFSEMNEFAASTMKQLSDMNFGVYDNMVKSQTELANIYVRSGLKQLDLARDIKDVATYAKGQKDLTAETMKEMVEFVQANVEMVTKNRDELLGWIESTTEAAVKLAPVADVKAA